MKIKLTTEQTIKGKDQDPGDEVIVNKDLGERLIEEGWAESLEDRVIEETENRVIEQPKNRMSAIRYSGHKKIFQGTNGKTYVQQGADYVEIEE